MPAGKLSKIGVWENGKYIGVVIFGLGATPNLCKSMSMEMTEVCELCRVALTKHTSKTTRIIRIAINFLKSQCPGIKMIVSFADTGQNHHGGIYQAGNWIFLGSKRLDSWVINGKKMHPRSVVAKYGSQAISHVKKFDKNAYKTWGIKHKYIYPLANRTKWEKMSKPYPKRVEHENNAPDYQSGESGAVPTNTLHSKAIE